MEFNMSNEDTSLVKKNTAPLNEDEIMMLGYYFEYATAYTKQATQLAKPSTTIDNKNYSIN